MIPVVSGAARLAGRALIGGGKSAQRSSPLKMSAKLEIDKKSFHKFRKKFGETTNQALVRLGVQTAKEAAILTQPMGRGKKKVVAGIVAGAKQNVRDYPVRRFNQIARAANDFRLRPDQILESPNKIDRFIERHRGKNGRAKKIATGEKGIAKTPDLKRVIKSRKQLAGIAKGSWIGTARELAKKAKGDRKPTVGKKFMGWAQRHADLGQAKFRPRNLSLSEVHLISNAINTASPEIFSQKNAKEAVRRSWRKTLKWYQINTSRKFA
tara:strand:- start:642 stop:1442 length:801 start_codon:yes stop_codon:yes gene_type:complete